jgi:uncharacterized RDD family membrane protein YckC
VIMVGVLVLLTIGAGYAFFSSSGRGQSELVVIIWLIGAFLLRNGYFILFEVGRRGATPGKRLLGLRVVARDGGRLTGDAVIARNAVRELEVYLPLSFLAGQIGEGGAEAWLNILGLGWTAIFLFFPLFNRDRLRVGDLLAGTWVVRVGRSKLGRNLAAAPPPASAPLFTEAQLAVYGEYELQTLEEVIRRDEPQAVAVVAESIRGKIDWAGPPLDDRAFLAAYYTALVPRLERGMLFGRRRKDKYDRG